MAGHGPGNFEFFGEERRVGVYCFYICDPDFGPGFIKICTYFPYPAKVWINGHEWAKRQAEVAGIDHTALSNGFASCPQPGRLQAICDGFGAQHVQWFFDRWSELIPTPFTDADRAAGYWWELSMRQVEVSRTLVFDDPRHARAFFEALVADTIAIGRPEQIALVFARQLRKTTKGPFRTRVFNPGTDVKIDFSYRHSRVKQYLKDGRALRIEAVINKPSDLGVLARLEHLPELIDKARAVTPSTTGCLSSSRPVRAVPSALRCLSASTSPTTERAIEPERCASGIHAPWPWPAPCTSCCTPSPASPTRAFAGTSPDSSAQPYSQSKMSYDLRRLRLHGLIARLPHSNTYVLTAEGVRVAVFYSKLHNRLLRPLLDADKPPAPIPVRRALATLEHAVNDYVHSARLAA